MGGKELASFKKYLIVVLGVSMNLYGHFNVLDVYG